MRKVNPGFVCAAVGLMFCAAAVAADAYPVGVDDILLIRSAQVKELDDRRFTVSKDGFLDLPLGGKVRAAGLQIPELREAIETLLVRYYHEPRVSIEIVEYRSQPVSVLGSVTNAGIYQLQGRKTLAEVLSMAGGLKPDAGYAVRVSRKVGTGGDTVEQVVSYPLSDIIKGQTDDSAIVYPRDVITVARAELVYVIGDVHRPGGFTLGEKEHASVLQTLALAEGALPTAALKRCTILRAAANGKGRVSIPVDVRHLISGKAADMMLEAGDILVIPSSTARKIGVKAAEAALQTGSGLLIWRLP